MAVEEEFHAMTTFARSVYAILPSLALVVTAQFPAAARAGTLYSTDALGNILYGYDTNTGIGSIISSDPNAINFPTGLALTSDGSTLYLANRGANDIEKFNTTTGAYTLFAGPSTGLVAPEDILLMRRRKNAVRGQLIRRQHPQVRHDDWHGLGLGIGPQLSDRVGSDAGRGDAVRQRIHRKQDRPDQYFHWCYLALCLADVSRRLGRHVGRQEPLCNDRQ